VTRLTSDILLKTDSETRVYADNVTLLTGMDPVSLAFSAAVHLKSISQYGAAHGGLGMLGSLSQISACVVPVTAGQGVIEGFTDAIEAALRYAGLQVIRPEAKDINGLYHAWERGADVVFLADDERYMAMNFRNGVCCDNTAATAYGYMTALEEMAGGPGSLKNRSVLLAGCGKVGCIAANALRQAGAALTLYDKNMLAARRIKLDTDRVITDAKDISAFPYILDATGSGAWLTKDMVREGAIIAAPAIPLSFTFNISERPDIRLFHDTLHTGTLVMLEAVL
jgi:pyrrolysine biosynthesis protein PylD